MILFETDEKPRKPQLQGPLIRITNCFCWLILLSAGVWGILPGDSFDSLRVDSKVSQIMLSVLVP
jgi:hypothetical protein